MNKHLPRELTSYDLLKTAAVVLMVIDHAGYYFFPDNEWWRVAGRLCVPVWFFLIGYARSRDFGPRLWVCMAIPVIANIVTGMSLVPLNVLATILAVRLFIDPLARIAREDNSRFWAACMVLFILALPSSLVFEYGTEGLMLALYGWFVRHWRESEKTAYLLPRYFAFAYITFVGLQAFTFSFEGMALAVFAAETLAVMAGLWFFRPAVYPALTGKLPEVLTWPVRFMGRFTPEIYAAHLVLFKFIALLSGDERFGWFDWVFFSVTGY